MISFSIFLVSLSIIFSRSIQVAANKGFYSFLWLTDMTYLYVFTYHSFSIHMSVDEHLVCFHILAMEIMLLGILEHMHLFKLLFSFFLDISRGVGLQNNMLALFLVLLKNLPTVFHSSYTQLYSYQQYRKFPFPQPSPSAFAFCRLLDDGHSDKYGMVPCCCFDLHFSNN